VGVNLVPKLGHDNGVDRIAFEVSTIAELLMLFIAVLIVSGQTADTDQFDMSGLF